jgi:hypothetical protein
LVEAEQLKESSDITILKALLRRADLLEVTVRRLLYCFVRWYLFVVFDVLFLDSTSNCIEEKIRDCDVDQITTRRRIVFESSSTTRW